METPRSPPRFVQGDGGGGSGSGAVAAGFGQVDSRQLIGLFFHGDFTLPPGLQCRFPAAADAFAAAAAGHPTVALAC